MTTVKTDILLVLDIFSKPIIIVTFINLYLFSCTGIHSKTGDILYKAQSQDEDALVHAAARLHMVYFNRNGNILGTVLVITFEGISD